MDYPNNLPCPNINMKVVIPFSNTIFRGQGKPKRRPIPQPLSIVELNFFMSESELNYWNEFYYNTLKNGTLEFNVGWGEIKKVKFYGKHKIKPNGNKYFNLSITAVVFNNILDDLVCKVINEYKDLNICINNFFGGL